MSEEQFETEPKPRPKSSATWRARLYLQAQHQERVNSILSSRDSNDIKVVDLLGIIAHQLIEQNYQLGGIFEEIYDQAHPDEGN